MRAVTPAAIVAISTMLAIACRPATAPDAPPMAISSSDSGYEVGVRLADITPPLHLSLFGHGPESRVATGVRLRLRCEVFVIAASGEAIALVPCDLQSPSAVLQRAIADSLRHVGVPLTADRIYLMATHTHAAPAHYFEARRYSGPFSSSIPGYDPNVVAFLADRIAAAIADAFVHRRPACLGWAQTNVEGLTFNRAYVPFLSNEPGVASTGAAIDPLARAKGVEQRAPVSPADAGSSPEVIRGSPTDAPERAVDPRLFVLRVDVRPAGSLSCEAGTPMGVFAVYAMHPTGAPNTNAFYHGDIFGFATRTAEACIATARTRPGGRLDAAGLQRALPTCEHASGALDPGDADPVVGLGNGDEGDVSPKLDFQSVPEARRLGRVLGVEIARAASSIAPGVMLPKGPLARVYRELSFPNGQSDDRGNTLCPDGELGMAAAGGARDGPTRLRVIPAANPGYRPAKPSGCHRYKLALLEGSPSEYDFPRSGPIAILQIANGLVATAPGEMTTMTGARIRSAILGVLAGGKPESEVNLALVGLTNQYLQYFATPEEYDFQYYEGASTLYGPLTEPFLTRNFACLAGVLLGRSGACNDQPAINLVQPLVMDPSPVVGRMPAEGDVGAVDTEPLDVCPVARDGAIGWETRILALPLTFTADRASFKVEVLDSSGATIDDDRGTSVEVSEIDDGHWRVRSIPALQLASNADARCGATFRLAVRGRVSLTSRPFTIDCADALRRGPL